jgi:lipid II:glycine glycyltransferase (peptidoglycan interpeptide bridge formation enzyme)
MIFNFGIVKMFYSNIPYGGFVGDFQLIPKSLALFEKSLKKDGIQLIRIGRNLTNKFPDLNEYQQQVAFTHVLSLEGMSKEQLWNSYKKRVRRDIRKAEKSGIYVEEITSPAEIEEIFSLYKQTMRRNLAYTTWTRKSFYSINENLVNTGKAKMMFAKKEGKIVAGIILLFSDDTVYYFFSASSEKYFQYCPNDLLVHHAICLAIQGGKKYFDMMTSREDDTSLMNFKEKWGAEKYPFYFFEKRLSQLRPWVWNQIWKMANSKIGTSLIRLMRGR